MYLRPLVATPSFAGRGDHPEASARPPVRWIGGALGVAVANPPLVRRSPASCRSRYRYAAAHDSDTPGFATANPYQRSCVFGFPDPQRSTFNQLTSHVSRLERTPHALYLRTCRPSTLPRSPDP